MKNNKWFVIPRPVETPALQLICFPYAGGNSSTYFKWEKYLPDEVEVVAIQPPGRGSHFTEKAYTDMVTLMDSLLPQFLSVVKGPYVLFGHSLGSRTAFELMQQLDIQGHQMPIHFVASGSPSPHLRISDKGTCDLSDNEFVQHLRSLNGSPEAILNDKQLLAVFLPSIRADFAIAENYLCESHPCFDVPASVIGGREDYYIDKETLRAWQKFFQYDIEQITVDGDHFFIEHHKHQVLEYINTLIDRILGAAHCPNKECRQQNTPFTCKEKTL